METKSKTILIVDDDADQLTQMKMVVEGMGFSALTADSQKAGEEILEQRKPDLAIVDLMMENKDSGFILSYKIKKKYPDVPVIIATAVSAETGLIFGIENKEEKNWIKADQYLEKGIRPDQLRREINRLLRL
ncbi:MAG: response regulator [Bacteroidales bacterium]|nr:response regulator [Bacteroidales bacterium]